MRKIIILLIFAFLCLPTLAANNTTVLVNDKKVNFESIDISENNIIFVSLRDLEKINWGTILPAENNGVLFRTSKMDLVFYKNSDSVKVNSLSLKLPLKTYVKNNKFMVPLSFVAKTLNADFTHSTQTVIEIKGFEPKEEPVKTVTKTTVETPKETTTEEVNNNTSENTNTTGKTVVKEYEKPDLNMNWFQGTVIAYSKKLNGIDIDLYSSDNKHIKTTTSKDGYFAFYNLKDGTYYIIIDNKRNPSFKTFKTKNFDIKGETANKITKPLEIIRASKITTPIQKVTVDKNDYYSVAWSAVPKVKTYKIAVTSTNAKALSPRYTAKTEKINIPLKDLSKGQTYSIKMTAYDENGKVIGEDHGTGWGFTTP